MTSLEKELEACCACSSTGRELYSPEERDVALRVMLQHLNSSEAVQAGRICVQCIECTQESYNVSITRRGGDPDHKEVATCSWDSTENGDPLHTSSSQNGKSAIKSRKTRIPDQQHVLPFPGPPAAPPAPDAPLDPPGDRLNSNGKYPLHRVRHFRQRMSWDCGVSCVLMLLSSAQREHFLNHFERICTEEGLQESTWTIDLCYLLKRYKINHIMYTSMAGVNEDYRNHRYYCNILDIDRARVEERFKRARAAGVEVREQGLASARLLAHLARGPAVVLVDAGLLACDICKHNKLYSQFRSCFGGSYKGHYILLVGHSRNKMLYRDPALSPRLCAASHATLQRAAAAAGTDDDCILVYLSQEDTALSELAS